MSEFFRKSFVLGVVLLVSSLGIGIGERWVRSASDLSFTHGLLLGANVDPKASDSEDKVVQKETYENLELFNRVLHFVKANYVDDVKMKTLILGAIKGMLETLDPHSNFLPAELYKDMQIDTSGKFGGLGIEIGMRDNILTIMAPIEDTPAWKAGLKPNDRIVKIDGESTKGMNLMEAVSKMRGKPKTDVTISIYREGSERIRDITITRDVIKIESVKNEILEPQYGYVRLTTFNESASHDMKKAILAMSKKVPLRGLVLDLRTNPGGLLEQAVEVSSLFIDEGIIVSTIGRDRNEKDVKYARKGSAFKDFSLAVLVNSSTASAAEIVAGALQDHHRAIILGQPTFGKGSVQTVIPLPPDMGLKLTIARYYTPSGRSIQEKGVQPDIFLDDFDPRLLAQAKYKGEYFREQDLKGHMVNTDEPSDSFSRKDFKKEEFEVLSQERKKAGKEKNAKEEEEMIPVRMNPKEDYQVKQALTSLKSYEIFKKNGSSQSAGKGDSSSKK
jgi:carboxyl-terminal processing protease